MEYTIVYVLSTVVLLIISLVCLSIVIFVFIYKKYSIKKVFIKINLNKLWLFIFLQLLSFVILYILGNTVLQNVYLIKWAAHNYFLFIWILVIIFSLLQKKYISFAITIGNLIGIIIGQLLGDMIRNKRILMINDAMDEGQKYFLSHHYGAFIWFITVIIFLVTGIILEIIYKQYLKSKR